MYVCVRVHFTILAFSKRGKELFLIDAPIPEDDDKSDTHELPK